MPYPHAGTRQRQSGLLLIKTRAKPQKFNSLAATPQKLAAFFVPRNTDAPRPPLREKTPTRHGENNARKTTRIASQRPTISPNAPIVPEGESPIRLIFCVLNFAERADLSAREIFRRECVHFPTQSRKVCIRARSFRAQYVKFLRPLRGLRRAFPRKCRRYPPPLRRARRL